MNTYGKLISVMFMGVLLSSVAGAHQTNVTVKNNTDKELELIVYPEGETTTKDVPEIKAKIAAHGETKLEVSKEQLGGSDVFAVKGSVTMPSLENVCDKLVVNKSYTLTFTATTMGGVKCSKS